MLWGWGPEIRREAAASALIYCNPRMIVQISDFTLSPAPLGSPAPGPWVVRARAICHRERSKSAGLGVASSPLYGNKAECFLSEIWEKCNFCLSALASHPPPWQAVAGTLGCLGCRSSSLRGSPAQRFPRAPQFRPGTPPAPHSFAGTSWLRHIQHPSSPSCI